jgi:hypothetical protein
VRQNANYYLVHKRGFELDALQIKENICFRMKLETLETLETSILLLEEELENYDIYSEDIDDRSIDDINELHDELYEHIT